MAERSHRQKPQQLPESGLTSLAHSHLAVSLTPRALKYVPNSVSGSVNFLYVVFLKSE